MIRLLEGKQVAHITCWCPVEVTYVWYRRSGQLRHCLGSTNFAYQLDP